MLLVSMLTRSHCCTTFWACSYSSPTNGIDFVVYSSCINIFKNKHCLLSISFCSLKLCASFCETEVKTLIHSYCYNFTLIDVDDDDDASLNFKRDEISWWFGLDSENRGMQNAIKINRINFCGYWNLLLILVTHLFICSSLGGSSEDEIVERVRDIRQLNCKIFQIDLNVSG